jgi:hypothetical protein
VGAPAAAKRFGVTLVFFVWMRREVWGLFVFVDDGTGDDIENLAGELIDASLTVGMNTVAEEDKEQIELGIDPQNRSRESAVTKRFVAQ